MSISTALSPDKESVYFQGSLTQVQSRHYSNINRDNLTFLDFIKNYPKKQSYDDLTDFTEEINKHSFLPNSYLFSKVINDARVIPNDKFFKEILDEYSSPRIFENFVNIYNNSPDFFVRLFGDTTSRGLYNEYLLYIYCLCMIQYIMKYHEKEQFKLIKMNEYYYNWALPKYSNHIDFIITGPLLSASKVAINFREHYKTIMNPINIEGDIVSTLQLTSLQNLDTRLNELLSALLARENSFNKLPDEARKYSLNINSLNVVIYNDSTRNNTSVIDLKNSDFGDTQHVFDKEFKFSDKINEKENISSISSLNKLQELFQHYSLISVKSFIVNKNIYIARLDQLSNIALNFDGMNISSRNISVMNSPVGREKPGCFQITGKFKENDLNTYIFVPDNEYISYYPDKVRITNALLYLTSNNEPIFSQRMITDINLNNTYNCLINISSKVDLLDDRSILPATLYEFSKLDFQNKVVPDDYSFISINNCIFLEDSIRFNVKIDWINSIRNYMYNYLVCWYKDTSDNSQKLIYELFDGKIVDSDLFTDMDKTKSIIMTLEEKFDGYNYLLKYNQNLNEKTWTKLDYYWSLLSMRSLDIFDVCFDKTTLAIDDTFEELQGDIILILQKRNGKNYIKTFPKELYLNSDSARYYYKYSYIKIDRSVDGENVTETYFPFEGYHSVGDTIKIIQLRDTINGDSTIDDILNNIVACKLYIEENINNTNIINVTRQACAIILPRLIDIPLLFQHNHEILWFDLHLDWYISSNNYNIGYSYKINNVQRNLQIYEQKQPFLVIEDNSVIIDSNTPYYVIDKTIGKKTCDDNYIYKWGLCNILKHPSMLVFDIIKQYSFIQEFS